MGERDERNRRALERIRTVAGRLSDEELLRPVDDVWSAAALFAHMAFWDRFCHARWMQARASGSRTPLAIDDALTELINDADIPHWSSLPARMAIDECIEAAERVNGLIATLDPDAVSEVIAEGRDRLVDRSLHRGEHLDMIERAFPEKAGPD